MCHKAPPPIQKLYRPRLLAGVAQPHIFDVDPEPDIIITEGRGVVTEIRVSPLTLSSSTSARIKVKHLHVIVQVLKQTYYAYFSGS